MTWYTAWNYHVSVCIRVLFLHWQDAYLERQGHQLSCYVFSCRRLDVWSVLSVVVVCLQLYVMCAQAPWSCVQRVIKIRFSTSLPPALTESTFFVWFMGFWVNDYTKLYCDGTSPNCHRVLFHVTPHVTTVRPPHWQVKGRCRPTHLRSRNGTICWRPHAPRCRWCALPLGIMDWGLFKPTHSTVGRSSTDFPR
jgi:hypothetical protein